MPLKLVCDESLCRGCEICVLTCSFKHTKVFSPVRSRIRVIHEYPTTDKPVFCVQCPDAPCAKACPNDAIYKDEKLGAWLVNEEKCVGCGACVNACPYNAMWIDPVTNKAIKCDLCGGDPECVKNCPPQALSVKTV